MTPRLLAVAAFAAVAAASAVHFAFPEFWRSIIGASERPAPTAESDGGKRRILYYRNPMGAPDTSPTPKKDSMGMDYIAVYEDEMSGPPGTVRLAPEKTQRAGVRTDLVARRTLTRTIRAYGTVAPDESRLATLTVKFEGFIEELLVPVTGAEVAAGQPLARVWIESREILQKQADYVGALRGAAGRPIDLARFEDVLRQFGLSDTALERLRRTGQPERSLTLTAAGAGTVLEKPAVNGMRFAPGTPLFRIADLSTVWIMAQVAERDLPAIRTGQTASVTLHRDDGVPVPARVAFIYPELMAATRTGSVRIEVGNPERRIRLGQYVDVAIETGGGDPPVVAIPDSAVIDSGTRRVAFVAKGDGLFEARDLVLGRRAGGFAEVRAGLSEGERIVTTGNFLIDSESNLRSALSGLAAPESVK